MKNRTLMTRIGLFVLAIVFVVWLSGAISSSYRLGTGMAFNAELTRSGISHEQWASGIDDWQRDQIRRSSRDKALGYAAFMGASLLSLGFAVFVSLGFSLRLRFFSRLRTFLLGLGTCAAAGLFMAFANIHMGQSTENAFQAAIGLAILYFVAFCMLTGLIIVGKKAFIAIFGIQSKNGEDAQSYSKQVTVPISARAEASESGPRLNWWRRKSHDFRRWIFGSVTWVVFVYLFVAMFDPFNNGSWYYMDDDEYNKMFFTMSIPWLAGGIKYLYDKFVK